MPVVTISVSSIANGLIVIGNTTRWIIQEESQEYDKKRQF